MIATTSRTTCFVYGTLMSTEVLQTLLGRTPITLPGVVLQNHVRHPVKGQVYPAVLPSTVAAPASAFHRDHSVEGILIIDLSPRDMKIFDYFEEEGIDYTRTTVVAHVPESSNAYLQQLEKNKSILWKDTDKEGYRSVQTNAYIWARGADTLDLTKPWVYEQFRKNRLEWYLESTVKPCAKEFNDNE